MTYKIFTAAAVAAAISSPVVAQELQGASVSGIIVSLDGETTTSVDAGADVALGRGFAVGANLGFYNDSTSDDTFINGTLHGMYMLSSTSALGLFVARDSVDGADADNFGIEYGFGSDRGRFEAYYGGIDDDSGIDQAIVGLSFEAAVSPSFFLTFDYDALVLADGEVGAGIGTGAFGARYQFEGGASIYAEVGSIAVSVTDGETTESASSDTFIGIGAEMNFGRKSGALFSNRTIIESFGF